MYISQYAKIVDDLNKIIQDRSKVVEACPSTGQPITQGEVDDYNAAVAKRREANNVKK